MYPRDKHPTVYRWPRSHFVLPDHLCWNLGQVVIFNCTVFSWYKTFIVWNCILIDSFNSFTIPSPKCAWQQTEKIGLISQSISSLVISATCKREENNMKRQPYRKVIHVFYYRTVVSSHRILILVIIILFSAHEAQY